MCRPGCETHFTPKGVSVVRLPRFYRHATTRWLVDDGVAGRPSGGLFPASRLMLEAKTRSRIARSRLEGELQTQQ